MLTGDAATAAAVSELAARVDVLHVAAHGRHSAENPMFSGLELVDGPWFGYDIDQLRAVPDVVLLSACEVGALDGALGRGADRHDRRLAARRRPAGSSPPPPRSTTGRRTTRWCGSTSSWPPGVDPAVALARAVPAVTADAPPVPLVCFG